jgi:hypothetical protein
MLAGLDLRGARRRPRYRRRADMIEAGGVSL